MKKLIFGIYMTTLVSLASLFVFSSFFGIPILGWASDLSLDTQERLVTGGIIGGMILCVIGALILSVIRYKEQQQ